jgi:N-acetylglucosamine-6-sulfatase
VRRAAPAACRPRALAGIGLVVALIALVLVAGPNGAAAQAGDDPRPNVIVVMTDDQTARSVRVMEETRRLLAGHGVSFANSFASFPLCCPSRVTYLTGQYAHNHGVTSRSGFPQFDDTRTTAVALQQEGYETGWVGKFVNGYPAHGREFPEDIPAGFDRWFVGLTGRMFDWSANDQGVITPFGSGPRSYQTDVYTREAGAFIRQSARAGQPFFLTVAPLAPHGEPRRQGRWPNPRPAPRDEGTFADVPLPEPPSLNEEDVSDKPEFLQEPRLSRGQLEDLGRRHRSRLESLLAVDRMVKRLMDRVVEAGERRDTYFVFTSDNGFLLGEHRLTGKVLLYEESARVPLIIRGPGLREDVRRRQPVANVDLAATILDITETAPLEQLDGRSLLPLATSPSVAKNRNVLLENRTSSGVRSRRYFYAEHDRPQDGTIDAFELYDLRRDPFQLRNRYGAPGYDRVTDSLEQRLDRLRDCAGSDCR